MITKPLLHVSALCLSTLMSAGMMSLALAGHVPAKAKTPSSLEVYSATEEDDGTPNVLSASTQIETTQVTSKKLKTVKIAEKKMVVKPSSLKKTKLAKQPITNAGEVPTAPLPTLVDVEKPIKKTEPPAAAQNQDIIAFESIPARQVESIANRLLLVERLVREYGRAYDYRTMTTRELERILAELDYRKNPSAAPVEFIPPQPAGNDGIFLLPEDARSAPGATPKESDEQEAPLPTLYGKNS